MKGIFNSTCAKFVLICLVFMAVIGCSFGNKPPDDIQSIPEDILLSEFIIGKWESQNVIDEEGAMSTYKYILEFVDSDTVKFSYLTSDGYFLDGDTSQYNFLETDMIFVDNKRILGGELWLLERDGQSLAVHRTVDNKTAHFTFIRTTGR